jgi:hypothetical protein
MENNISLGKIFDVMKGKDGTVLLTFSYPIYTDRNIRFTLNAEKAYEDLKKLVGQDVRIEWRWAMMKRKHWWGIEPHVIEYLSSVETKGTL